MVTGIISGIIMYSNRNSMTRKYWPHSPPLKPSHSRANDAGMSEVPTLLKSPSAPITPSTTSGSAVSISGMNTTVPRTSRFLKTSDHSLRTITLILCIRVPCL